MDDRRLSYEEGQNCSNCDSWLPDEDRPRRTSMVRTGTCEVTEEYSEEEGFCPFWKLEEDFVIARKEGEKMLNRHGYQPEGPCAPMGKPPASGSGEQERYGRTRVSRIRKRIDTLRQAIRAEGTEAIQDAWDELEAFLPYFMKEN